VKQLKIFFQAVIFRVYIIIVLAGWLFGQTVPSIHQTQLEYYKQNYILPGFDFNGQPSPTGLYLVSISNGKTVHSRKVTLLK
jgi:hypothetical protein